MSRNRFTNYNEARDHAESMARQSGHDVAIRKTKEFGQWGFNVSYAAWMDSDYARAEIVKGNEPFTKRERKGIRRDARIVAKRLWAEELERRKQ